MELQMLLVVKYTVDWDSVVSIATLYRLDSVGIKSWWGEIFHTHPEWH